MKFNLLHSYKKATRSEMHAKTLSEYYRANRIPKGLRVTLEPTIGKDNPAFCERWCEILNHCSMDLMLLIISNTKEEFPTIRTNIEQQHEDAKKALNTAEYDSLIQEVQDEIDKYKQEVLEMKLSKFRRDANDYINKRVYPWLSQGPRPRRTRYNLPGSNSREPPSSASASDSDLSQTQEQAPLPQQQPGFFEKNQTKSQPATRASPWIQGQDPVDPWPPLDAARGERGRGKGGRGRRW